MFQNGFAGVKGLGPASSAGEPGETILSLFVESDGEHEKKVQLLYAYSNPEKTLSVPFNIRVQCNVPSRQSAVGESI